MLIAKPGGISLTWDTARNRQQNRKIAEVVILNPTARLIAQYWEMEKASPSLFLLSIVPTAHCEGVLSPVFYGFQMM